MFLAKKKNNNNETISCLQSYVSTYNIQIRSSSDLEQQLKDTKSAISSNLKDLLNELTGSKFVKTLLYAKKCSTFFSNSKAKTIINENYINDLFRSVYGKIILNIQKSLGKDLSWIVDLVVNNTINISK